MGGNSVPFKTLIKYLGVHLDRTLSMQQHVSSICRASFPELRRIASIRPKAGKGLSCTKSFAAKQFLMFEWTLLIVCLYPEGRPGMSDVPLLSGISGLSYDSPLLSPLLFFSA